MVPVFDQSFFLRLLAAVAIAMLAALGVWYGERSLYKRQKSEYVPSRRLIVVHLAIGGISALVMFLVKAFAPETGIPSVILVGFSLGGIWFMLSPEDHTLGWMVSGALAAPLGILIADIVLPLLL